MSDDNKKSIFREIFLEGITKFGGEIVGAVLLGLFFWYFPAIKSWITEPASTSDGGGTVISHPAMSDAEFVGTHVRTGLSVYLPPCGNQGAGTGLADGTEQTAHVGCVRGHHLSSASGDGTIFERSHSPV